MEIVELINKLSILMQLYKVASESENKKQYSEREILLLELINTENKLSISGISEKFPVIGKSILSSTISDFWKNGLVNKERDFENQRITNVSLTKKGQKLLETIRKKKSERFDFLTKSLALTLEEEKVVKIILERAIESLDEKLTQNK